MKDLVYLLPEVFLAVTLVGIIMSEVGYHGERYRLLSLISIIGLAMALIQVLLTYVYGPTQAFSNTVVVDGFALFFKVLFIVLAILTILTSMYSKEISGKRRAEFCTLILSSTLAMCLIASAADLLLAFLCLQFLNVMGYLMVGKKTQSVLSTEASIKHLAFGAVAGALFLYGVAILFATTHSFNIYEMHRALTLNKLPLESGTIAFGLMFFALSFQIGGFPMHLWAPDVLQGAPTAASSFLSVGSRAAGFALALRILIIVFAQPALAPGEWQVLGSVDWPNMIAILSGATMLIGALLAYRQNSAKRLVAYLVIAETGFLLMGILVLDEVGVSALLFNLVVELFALTGAFYILSFIYDQVQSDRLEDLKGVLARAVPECTCLIIFLACLVGLPPLPGFIGKFALIGAAIRHNWHFLALIAVGSIAIVTAAVGRLAFSLMGDFRQLTQIGSAASQPIATTTGHRVLLAGLVVPMILLAVFAELLLSWVGQSIQFNLW